MTVMMTAGQKYWYPIKDLLFDELRVKIDESSALSIECRYESDWMEQKVIQTLTDRFIYEI